MSQPTSKFGFRSWLFVAIVFAFTMASCCPPALLERPVEKNNKQVAAEMPKATSQEKKNP